MISASGLKTTLLFNPKCLSREIPLFFSQKMLLNLIASGDYDTI